MPDLAREFFERDLSDAEWRQLGEQLTREGAVADQFLASAQAYYTGLGLPEPGSGPRGGGMGGGGLGAWSSWLAALAVGTALGSLVVHFWFPATPSLIAPVQIPAQLSPIPTQAPAALSHPRPSLPQPTLQAPPAGAAPRIASPGFPGLSAVVHLASQGLVTARVLDANGEEQRVLYAGVLEAGSWRFGWDGRDEAGSILKPGRYTIEVQEGSHVLKKSVDVSAKAPGP